MTEFKNELTTQLQEQFKEMSKEAIDKMINEALNPEFLQQTVKDAINTHVQRGLISVTAGQLIQAGANAGGEVVKAGANYTATQKMLDAQQKSIEAKRFRMMAEMMQQHRMNSI